MKKDRNYPKPVLTPGEVARRSGVAVSALHFYETKGLIFSTRNGGNQRRYSRDVLRRVAIIKIAQRIGIPLATVSDSLEHIPANKRMSAPEWDALTQHWREELDKRIETLTVTDQVAPMSVGLAWHRERAFTPAMQAVRDYFHDAFLAPQQLSARR